MLKQQGHEVIGIRFTLWSDPLAPAIAQLLPNKCCNAQTSARCAHVANMLGIPLHVIDMEDEFKRNVVDPFLSGYARGETPNPCIACNKQIKFGMLFRYMERFGCDMIATGHYARIGKEQMQGGRERIVLLESSDLRKDQSYYLYGLSQEQLPKILFPLGHMRKEDVFALAKTYGIPFDEGYRESQDLCFFPEKEPTAFIKRHIAHTMKPGHIIRRDGTIVGSHEGLPLYTVGQRRGLGIGGLSIPLEVVGKDIVKNELIVAERGSELVDSVTLRELNWISWRPREGVAETFECRTRSLTEKLTGTMIFEGETGVFTFTTRRPPLTPGQSLVLYRGPEIVGGGIMNG